jgi:hypothetical protein
MSQHATLTPERWAGYGLDQQILMIANEMNRAGKLTRPDDHDRRQRAYARILSLADLTVAVNARRALRRELLRWRDLVAALYLSLEADPARHRAAFRCLLRFTPAASRQIPFVIEGR